MNKNYKISLMLMFALALGTNSSVRALNVADYDVESTSDVSVSMKKKDIADILSVGQKNATKTSVLKAARVIDYNRAMSAIRSGGQTLNAGPASTFLPYFSKEQLGGIAGAALESTIRFVTGNGSFDLKQELVEAQKTNEAEKSFTALQNAASAYLNKLSTASTDKQAPGYLSELTAEAIQALASGSKKLSDALPTELKKAMEAIKQDKEFNPYMLLAYGQLSKQIKDTAEKISGQSTNNILVKGNDQKEVTIADAALRMNILTALAQSLSDGAQETSEIASPAVSTHQLNAATGMLDNVFGLSFIDKKQNKVEAAVIAKDFPSKFSEVVQKFSTAVSKADGSGTDLTNLFKDFTKVLGDTGGFASGGHTDVLGKAEDKTDISGGANDDADAKAIASMFPEGYVSAGNKGQPTVRELSVAWNSFFAKTLSAKNTGFSRNTEFSKTSKESSIGDRLKDLSINIKIYDKNSKLSLSMLGNRYDAAEKKIKNDKYDRGALEKFKEAIDKDYNSISKQLKKQIENTFSNEFSFQYGGWASFVNTDLQTATKMADGMTSSYNRLSAILNEKLGSTPSSAEKEEQKGLANTSLEGLETDELNLGQDTPEEANVTPNKGRNPRKPEPRSATTKPRVKGRPQSGLFKTYQASFTGGQQSIKTTANKKTEKDNKQTSKTVG